MNNKNDPFFMNLDDVVDDYQLTIHQAQERFSIFKKQLEQLSKGDCACVKFYFPVKREASSGANIWLMNPFFKDGLCYAQPFVWPEEFDWIQVGQWLRFDETDLLDWYILSENGNMQGGYSLRYQRSPLPGSQKIEFDQHVGVSEFID